MRDPAQYARFADQRSRPFFNLLDRVPADSPFSQIVDLGCGAGELTVELAHRWPAARVLGLDNSASMLERSGDYEIPGRLSFALGDIDDYSEPADLIFANAALQWVDDHEALFPRLAALVNPGGVFAVQMPFSHVQPSHELLEQLARTGPWASKLAAWHRFQVLPLDWYVGRLIDLGFEVDAWATTYYFLLPGENPVREWVKGTALQPILNLLDNEEQVAFLDQYSAKLKSAYPQGPAGTIYPFNRIFFVARRL